MKSKPYSWTVYESPWGFSARQRRFVDIQNVKPEPGDIFAHTDRNKVRAAPYEGVS
jgi:hypothetical protein